jgi:hypothetical protein
MKKQLQATAKQSTCRAFTLVELLISVVIVTMIIFMVAQLMTSATTVTRTSNKHIDTDTQARVVLDRLAVDFAQMFRRTDVDYYVKAPTGYKNPNAHGKGLKLQGGAQKGNDQIAFFSQTPGYNDTSSSWQSPVSLVAYRVNGNPNSASYLMLERMGKGLLWNGVSNSTNPSAIYPIVFIPGQIAAGTGPWAGPWYAAVNNDTTAKSSDPDYQTIGPGVFRLEYYYLRKDGSIKDIPAISWVFTQNGVPVTLSANLNAFSDVEAIVVAIAVIDPATRSMILPATLVNMLSDMADFKNANGIGVGAQKIGDLENNWNLAVQSAASTGTTSDGSPFPPAAASAIRVYNRYFDLRTLANL